MTPRGALPADLSALAIMWHTMWHVAHAAHLPDVFIAARTLNRFEARLPAMLDATRVVGPIGAPIGFCTLEPPELYQLYTSPDANGKGVASTLIMDAEAILAANGVARAFLYCLPENARAVAFYERAGWRFVRTEDVELPDANGLPTVSVARFEKDMPPQK